LTPGGLPGAGVNIIIQYDGLTVATAPAGFFTAVQYAVAQADALIADNITLTINFSWGQVGGQALPVGSVGASLTPHFVLPYSQVRAALVASETTLDDFYSVSSLPLVDPSGGRGIQVSVAQALALGIPGLNTNGVAGFVGLDASSLFEFSQTATAGAYDAIGTLYHEISEVLGRTSDLAGTSGNLTILDLFRYSAPGAHTLSTIGAYFSPDTTTLVAPFNNPANGGDAGDWAPSVGDAFAEAASPGPVDIIAMPDLRELDVLGFRLSTPLTTNVFPVFGSTSLSTAPEVSIFFNEAVTAGHGNLVIHRSADGSVFESVAITDASRVSIGNGAVAAYLPFFLALGTSYYVTLDAGAVVDALGNSFIGLGGNSSSAFTTPTATQETAFWLLSVLRDGSSAAAIAFGQQVVGTLASGDPGSALHSVVTAADATTSVATLAYEFFTGKTPSAGGMDYLVSPTGPNPNNLNAAYYQNFTMENRYINFAVNLGKVGAGEVAFNTAYGNLSLFDATRQAYATIFGGTPSDTKLHAILDPTTVLNGVTYSRADYFTYYGGDGPNGLGTKAAMVGWLLSEAEKADLGTYAQSNDAFLNDVALHNVPFGVDLVGHYSQPSFVFNPG
jgi:hypothetical protein